MAVGQETLWERFFKPVVNTFIDQDQLNQLYKSKDWEKEGDRFRNPQVIYPDYYQSQNFHGIERGYLNPGAAVSYDPITQYFLPPNETWVRQAAIDKIGGYPRRILDLGCGTGSTTLLLKKAFPNAEVIGIDLSPYMLVMAEDKANTQGLEVTWKQANATVTGFPDGSFDVVTASLLFHETPSWVISEILQEMFRLLCAGGQIVILDGNQKTLTQMTWLMEIFEEPYIHEYAKADLEKYLKNVGFVTVQRQEFWWIHQISYGRKPNPVQSVHWHDERLTWGSLGLA